VMQRVTTGDVLPGDIDLHREIAAIIENPLYLLLDTTDGAGVRDLPVQMLESEVHMIDDTPTLTFAKSSYHLQTEEAERISVDQVCACVSVCVVGVYIYQVRCCCRKFIFILLFFLF
jgi:hypothetical protein